MQVSRIPAGSSDIHDGRFLRHARYARSWRCLMYCTKVLTGDLDEQHTGAMGAIPTPSKKPAQPIGQASSVSKPVPKAAGSSTSVPAKKNDKSPRPPAEQPKPKDPERAFPLFDHFLVVRIEERAPATAAEKEACSRAGNGKLDGKTAPRIPTVAYRLSAPASTDYSSVVPWFCFPDAEDLRKKVEMDADQFTFVLTEGDGRRVFGHCKRCVYLIGHLISPLLTRALGTQVSSDWIRGAISRMCLHAISSNLLHASSRGFRNGASSLDHSAW